MKYNNKNNEIYLLLLLMTRRAICFIAQSLTVVGKCGFFSLNYKNY